MVLGLWAADWLARAVVARQRPAPLAAEALAVPLSGAAGLWAAGFFVLRTGHGGEGARYGEMQLDLLAPFDPSFWGAFLPDLPGPDHLEVGSSYAGLGILLLLVAGGLAWLRRPLRGGLSARWPLLLSLLAMLAIAVTTASRSAAGRWRCSSCRRPWSSPPPRSARPSASCGPSPTPCFWRPSRRSRTGSAGAAPGSCSSRWSRCSSRTCNRASRGWTASSPSARRWRRCACPTRSGPRPRATTAASAWCPTATRRSTGRKSRSTARPWGWKPTACTSRASTPRASRRSTRRRRRGWNEGRHEPATLYTLGDAAALERARRGMDPSRDLLARFNNVWVLAPNWWPLTGRDPPLSQTPPSSEP